MAQDGYAKGAVSDADLIHGCGNTGSVLHQGTRHSDITSSTRKGMDSGMGATLGRPKATSDFKGSTPEDVTTAPGQRTTQSLGYGAAPAKKPVRAPGM